MSRKKTPLMGASLLRSIPYLNHNRNSDLEDAKRMLGELDSLTADEWNTARAATEEKLVRVGKEKRTDKRESLLGILRTLHETLSKPHLVAVAASEDSPSSATADEGVEKVAAAR